jgi:hypothetical protein
MHIVVIDCLFCVAVITNRNGISLPKFTSASQALYINQYRNVKNKIHVVMRMSVAGNNILRRILKQNTSKSKFPAIFQHSNLQKSKASNLAMNFIK